MILKTFGTAEVLLLTVVGAVALGWGGVELVRTGGGTRWSEVVAPRPGGASDLKPRSSSAFLEALNQIGVAELAAAVPGIGETLARRIVVWRQEHGPFRRPEDLMQVPGVGRRRMERIRRSLEERQWSTR